MSKFCTSCGSQIPEGANACPGCGAPVAQEETATPATPVVSENVEIQPEVATTTPNNNKNNTMVGIIAVAVVAIIVLALIFGLFGGSYKTPIKNMLKGIENDSWKTYSKAFTEDQIDSMEDWYDGDDFIEGIHDELEDEFGKKIKLSVDFKDKDKLDEDDIEDLEDNYDDMYDEKIHIKKAYEVECEVTIEGKKDDDSADLDFIVGKIGSKWYILENDLGF